MDACKREGRKMLTSGYQACKHREFEIRLDGVAYMRIKDSGSIFRMKWTLA